MTKSGTSDLSFTVMHEDMFFDSTHDSIFIVITSVSKDASSRDIWWRTGKIDKLGITLFGLVTSAKLTQNGKARLGKLG